LAFEGDEETVGFCLVLCRISALTEDELLQ